MRKLILIVATMSFVGAGALMGSASAQENTCKGHKDQTSCSGDTACSWVAADKECHKAKKRK